MRSDLVARVGIVMLVVLGLLGGTPAARAEQVLTAESVALNLSRMTPLNPQPGKVLRLAGTMRNRSNQTITSLQVRLLLSSAPIAYRGEIGEVIDGSTLRDGPPTLAVSEPVAALMPRVSMDWSLELPLDELPLNAAGVYVMGLEVIGTGEDGLTQRYGLTRTFLPWYPEGTVVQPTRVAWLWPLTSTPDRALNNVLLSEQTAAELAAGGRLSRIVAAAGDAAITWVMDPCLLQTAQAMSEGYTVAGPDTSTQATGAGGNAAGQWLDAVRDVAGEQQTLATPYALPDAMALERAGMPRVNGMATRGAAEIASNITGTRVSEVLAWPPGGFTTPAVMRRYQKAGATELLLSDAEFPAGLTYTPDGFTTWSDMPVALADAGLGAALAMPQDSRGQALLARQRFLAEVAMTAGELPETARGMVAAPDTLWNPRTTFLKQTIRALQRVPYGRLVSLQTARRQAVDVSRTRVPYGADQKAGELPQDYLNRLRPQRVDARRLSAILTDPAGLGYDQALMRQTSGAWRTDLDAASTLQNTVSEQLRQQIGQVRVATTGVFTLPGDTGRIPVTVANDLKQDVTVGIRLESDEPARLSAEDVEPFEVPAGRKVSLEVEAKVVGSGTLPVKIQLTTPDGRRYGQPVAVEVRTTAYSQAAAYVVSGAFVILAFLLGMNFVRRLRARREAHNE